MFISLFFLKLILIGSGIGITADGIGSILVKSNYHGLWFDVERYIRSGLGIFLLIVGILA